MSILSINKLSLDLVARDFSDGHSPNNGGPTKTARERLPHSLQSTSGSENVASWPE